VASNAATVVFAQATRRWALVAVALIFIQFASSIPTNAQKAGGRTFVGASSNNFPPVNILDEEGDLTGFGRELSDAVIKAIGGTVTHIDSNVWTEVLQWLADGKADFIHDTGFAEKRLAYLDFSEPILSMEERIFVKTERNDINSFEDLKGKRVACVNQHITHIYLKDFPEIGCVLVKRPVDGILAILNGDVDAFIFPKQIALYYAYSLHVRSSVKIVGKALRTLNWHMTVRKGNREMLALLNQGIAEIRAIGEYRRIYDKWFGESLFKGYASKTVTFFVAGAIAFSLLVAGLIFAFFHIFRMEKAHERLQETQSQKDRAEAALTESERRYHEIIESHLELISRYQPDGTRTFLNKTFCQFLGKTEEELLQSSLFGILHPDDVDRVREILDHSSSHDIKFEMENRILRHDGEYRLIQWVVQPILDDGGNIVEFQSAGRDITEHRRLEAVSGRLAAAIDSLALNVVLFDAEDRIVFRNKAWKEFNEDLSDIAKTGVKYETLLRATIDRGLVPEARGREEEWFQRRLERHRNPGEEFEIARQDGKHMLVQIQRLPDGGRATIATDITNLKQSETDLIENEELLETIIGNVANGLITMDEDGTILSFTHRAEATFGYDAIEVVGQNVRMLMPNPTRANHDSYLAQYCKTGEKHIIGNPREVTALRKNGTTFPLELGVSELLQGGQRIFMGTVLDRTEQARAKEQRKKIEAQLRQSQKLETIGTLANGIAHDFNNILSPIMGYVDMALMDLPQDEQTYKNMVQVRMAAERAKALVGQMLVAAGKGEQEPQAVLVTEIVEEALRLLRPSLPSTIDIRTNLDESCPPVRADSTQIHQVVMNLCTNAYQAMEEQGGVLTIDVDVVGGDDVLPGRDVAEQSRYVRVGISDTGTGMESSQLERIFEPFYTTKPIGEGTGLGLSVVQGIISSHGGVITVDSTPGAGTTFHVYLPVMENVPKAQTGATPIPPTFRGNGHILYVDDEIEIAEMGRQMLERLGYRVTVAASAPEAFEIFQADPDQFNIVVTDHTMPKMTGAELAEKLSRLHPGLPIILMTGSGEIIRKARNEYVCIDAFLMKPVVMHELSSAVKSSLEKAKS
jgi:PAS domain S-box-containing protein